MSIVERLEQHGVVPVASVPDAESAVRVCEALTAGGLPVIEITFRTVAAASAIAAAAARFPGVAIGAGTVLSAADAQAARDAGAAFAVAPGFNPKVVDAAVAVGLPFFPGVSTPSEIEAALGQGCRVQKLFPAEALGGAAYLKAVAAPYAHRGVRFIPTGGVSEANLPAYLSLRDVVAVGGTWIVPAEAIVRGDWASITARAVRAVERVRAIRGSDVPA